MRAARKGTQPTETRPHKHAHAHARARRLYLDLDTECIRNVEGMLEGYDVVLQGHGVQERLANGMMASAPGHPLWAEVRGLFRSLCNNLQPPR